MSDEKPPLGEVWETSWPSEMDERERVLSIVTTAHGARSADWIADRAGVDDSTARSILNTAEDVNKVDSGYRVEPEARHRRQKERIEEKSDAELRELRKKITEELDSDDEMADHHRRQREYLLEMIDSAI